MQKTRQLSAAEKGALAAFLILSALVALPACMGRTTGDPLTADPDVLDRDHPATLVEAPAGLVSHGKRLNGILYLAQGPGPHPTAVLLHGLPGNERNLDLAQALRRNGWNVVFCHYRGAWGSEGDFSFVHSVEDVASMMAFVRGEEAGRTYRIDRDRVVVIGHSMGGWAALLAAAQDPEIKAVISIAGWNAGLPIPPEAANQIAAYLEDSLPLRVASGQALIDELRDDELDADLLHHAESLADRSLLLIAGRRDTVLPRDVHHAPLVEALRVAGGDDVTEVLLDSDHAFSDRRIALTRTILDWLDARFP